MLGVHTEVYVYISVGVQQQTGGCSLCQGSESLTCQCSILPVCCHFAMCGAVSAKAVRTAALFRSSGGRQT